MTSKQNAEIKNDSVTIHAPDTTIKNDQMNWKRMIVALLDGINDEKILKPIYFFTRTIIK